MLFQQFLPVSAVLQWSLWSSLVSMLFQQFLPVSANLQWSSAIFTGIYSVTSVVPVQWSLMSPPLWTEHWGLHTVVSAVSTSLHWSLQFAMVSAVSAGLHWPLWCQCSLMSGTTEWSLQSALCGLHSLLSLHSVNAPVCSLVSQASTSVKGCGFTSFPWSAVWSALVFNGLCSFPLCSLKWHSLVSAVSICLKSLQLSLYSCRKGSTNSSCRIRSTAKDIWQMCSFKYQRT